jgi:hypothetical protein
VRTVASPVNVPGGSLHLVVDVLAWFTDDPTFTALTPARLADTRPGQPTVDGAHAGGGPALAGSSLTFVAAGRGGVPSTGVGAVVLNLTAVRPTATTFLTAFPAGRARPLASSLNVAAGTTRANLVVVPLGPGGTVSVFQHAGARAHRGRRGRLVRRRRAHHRAADHPRGTPAHLPPAQRCPPAGVDRQRTTRRRRASCR